MLVVEDDQNLRVVIRMVLEHAGYEVSEARNGIAAIEMLATWMPDLIIADMRMPLMDGAELMARLRSNPTTATIPIVLLSGLPADPSVSRLADAVVNKPFEPADLVAAIRHSLAGEVGA